MADKLAIPVISAPAARMPRDVFDKFCRVIYERCGIRLAAGKEALVDTRIGRRMRMLGIDDPAGYLDRIQRGDADEMVHLLDAITTNVTSFFREPAHFDFLRTWLDKELAQSRERFRFWSAACSTGEEPYSLAITVADVVGAKPIDWRVLATDISTRVLERCRRGVYESRLVAAIPAALRERYFRKRRQGGAVEYEANAEVKEHLVFNRLNLAAPPFPMKGPLDVIFCRNVMIYFDRGVRQRLVDEAYRLMRPGGLLIVGHSESLMDIETRLHRIQPSVYVK